MSNLISKIETLLLKKPLEAICFATIIYLMRNGKTILPLNEIKVLAEFAVNISLPKINNSRRRVKVLEVLTQTDIIYQNFVGLNAIKGLSEPETIPNDDSREEIYRNLRALKSKLGAPMIDTDVPLYATLKTNLDTINPSKLTWRDPEANMIIADDSVLLKNLGLGLKQIFLKLCENMKCALPTSISSRCVEFVNNFNRSDIPITLGNIVHIKEWKEEESNLLERTNCILSILGGIWKNPAYSTSEIRSTQSEGTYITDVIVPLLRASLEDLPNGSMFLSTAERQNVMAMTEYRGKIFELVYVESSRVICINKKKENDSVKLWRETLDGISFVGVACRPTSNQFGIIGIQVAGEEVYLNALVKDASGIPRYFHLDQAKIPHALEQANTHSPRNVHQSPVVSSPKHN
ncbi:hypothetical protein F8M41_012945 [Gigaspora margarita]|uniref:Uncharacterized protein n=1 Tax=Gigaspora margarita TaxID=4874 RepID=A0A8H3WYD2_GIGMA|nr:hypothetical protein F8M41_012945 [Gigaspora margarita]